MDLYSAAQWLSRPFHFTEQTWGAELPLDARGLIGDGNSAALVRADGAIDWLCLPRFDSPSVFAALLDAQRGGLCALWPAQRNFESLQRYDPDTNVLETLFRVPGQGVARLTDFMPWTGDARASIFEVHRRLECLEGEVDIEAVFDPRFGYGAGKTTLELLEHGVLAQGEAGERLVAVLSGGERWELGDRGATARLRLRAGRRRWLLLSWNAVRPEPWRAYRPFEHLRATRQAWRNWSGRLTYEGPWRHHVLRSALALKLMIHAPTGAMVAAPTTSVPEWLGGGRNWDYRYSWTRDAAMAIRSTHLIGYPDEAREFFHFVRDTLTQNGSLQVMYAVDGAPVPDERVVQLRGHRGSSPVRVGNGARDQVQLDTSGALLDAAYHYERFGGRLQLRAWRRLRAVADSVCERWREPDHGIWEPRGGTRHHTHSKLMCWVALHRAQHLGLRFGELEAAGRWREQAEHIHRDLLEQGLDSGRRHFVATYGGAEMDAALLLLPVAGCFDPKDPLVHRTIDRVREELASGPFLYRYHSDDGVGGPEGTFTLCGFWLAEALALAGRLDEAQEVFTAHADCANHLGLLAEQYDPAARTQLGNFPQAFSHLGLINAASRIDLGLRLRDEGVVRSPRLVDLDLP